MSVAPGLFFGIQKCDLSLGQEDPECANAPFSYTMNVKFDVYAVNKDGYTMAENSDVNFNINVSNPCPAD